MTLINALVASSALALGVLLNSASPANALVAQGHGLNARAAHSPNHNGMMKRKRSHKNRKRCVQQQHIADAPSASVNVDAPAPTPDAPPPAPYYPPPSHAQTCGDGAKVGIAWGPSTNKAYFPNAITGRTCWYYNWSAWVTDSYLTGNLKFVPMLWGQKELQAFIDQIINKDVNYGIVLGMNEVNQQDQALMNVDAGIDMWNQYIVPLKYRGYTLVSPSTTSAPDGMDWMKAFMYSNRVQVRPDIIAIHWYGLEIQRFKEYVDSFANEFQGYPIWITEFACTDFNGGYCDVMGFAREAKAFLDNHPRVQAYFPFAFEDTMSNVGEPSRLMYGWGQVTDLGNTYLY